MTTITLELPDELAVKMQAHQAEAARIINLVVHQARFDG
jgi:hypothetical protein